MAQVLDITERRVMQLTQDGIIEEHCAGGYRLLPTLQRYIRYLRAGQDNVEFAKIKRESAALDLALKKGEMHKTADVEFVVTNMLVAFKSKLETLPHKTLPAIIGVPDGDDRVESVTAILKSAFDEALAELSPYDPAMFNVDTYVAGLDDTVFDEMA
ncbi:MAG: hypothetical protein FWC13_07620 [Oscillospiraceae bacterium]|nr:hypothetical protein [Oscillospiraceae bacterium]